MIKQVRVLIEDDLHAQAKSHAALEGVSLAAWIEAAIKAQLAKPIAARSTQPKTKGTKPIK